VLCHALSVCLPVFMYVGVKSPLLAIALFVGLSSLVGANCGRCSVLLMVVATVRAMSSLC